MNDCEGHETIFVEATEICLIFDYYDINKVGNSYRLRLFDFTPLILVCLFFSPQLLNLTIRFSGKSNSNNNNNNNNHNKKDIKR